MQVESVLGTRLRRFATWLFGLGATCITAATSASAQSPTQFLDLDITRPLTSEEAKVLSEILVQSDIAQTVRSAADEARPIEEICALANCSSLAGQQLREAAEIASQRVETGPAQPNNAPATPELSGWEGGVLLPGSATRDGKSYLVVDPASPAGSQIGTTGLAAVPLDGADQAIPDLDGPLVFQSSEEPVVVAEPAPMSSQYVPTWRDGSSPEWGQLQSGTLIRESSDGSDLRQVLSPGSLPGQVIDADIRRTGQSLRSFPIRSGIPPEQLAAAVAALEGIGAHARSEDEPRSTSLDVPENVVRFEGFSAQCRSDQTGRPWPYDVAEVIRILKFNDAVMEDLGLTAKRSLVMIVDTGVGGFLAETKLRMSFAPNPDELLNPPDEFITNDGDANSIARCVDRDRNDYSEDIYGASSAYSVGEEESVCGLSGSPGASRNPGTDSRILAIPLREGSDNTKYFPGHGSFVSVLATGGPELLSKYPQIRRNIGLRFFRVTREPPSGVTNASIAFDPQDMVNAIKYALDENVTVVNLSMKSWNNANLRDLFEQGALRDTLVVTSAGNRGEDLNNEAGRAIPAGLMNTNLIVVGGLADDSNHSWWQKSAFGDKFVSISAPSVHIPSLDEFGEIQCYDGTSGAAPIVTFVAAVLSSYGLDSPGKIKERILNSADVDEDLLRGKVKNSRKLNVPAALDIFADRVILADGSELLRGRIVTKIDESRLIRACRSDAPGEPLAGSQGWIDPYHLRSWHHRGEQVLFEDGRNVDELIECRASSTATLDFVKVGEEQPTSIPLAEIESIVLSPFRSIEVEMAVLFDDVPIEETTLAPRQAD